MFPPNDFSGETSDDGTSDDRLDLATPPNMLSPYPIAIMMPSSPISERRVGRTVVSVLSLPPYSSVSYTTAPPNGQSNNPHRSSFPLVYDGQRKRTAASM